MVPANGSSPSHPAENTGPEQDYLRQREHAIARAAKTWAWRPSEVTTRQASTTMNKNHLKISVLLTQLRTAGVN